MRQLMDIDLMVKDVSILIKNLVDVVNDVFNKNVNQSVLKIQKLFTSLDFIFGSS